MQIPNSQSSVTDSDSELTELGYSFSSELTELSTPKAPMMTRIAFALWMLLTFSCNVNAQSKVSEGGITSLTNSAVKYRVAKKHYVVLQNDMTEAIVVDNAAIDIPELPKHRAGYSGVASLTHKMQKRNLFVPGIAGLNFEHIHDGTTKGLVEKFEPRKFPMELRIISDSIVELYQPPTKNWKLESCGRYELLDDGTIEYTFECIPRSHDYAKDFIGLFWASYIHQPEDKAIFFKGRKTSDDNPHWIKAVTPRHGVRSTHRPMGVTKLPPVDDDFPLTLVNHPSEYECSESWYYGVCRDMAVVQMFRPGDKVWVAQSPSGGGNGNPAWDFQWFINKPKVNHAYRLVMRMSYFKFKNVENVINVTKKHRQILRNSEKGKR